MGLLDAFPAEDRFGLETSCRNLKIELTQQTQHHLLLYVSLLRKWQPAQNLVGPGTLADVWSRHVTDSLQLIEFIDEWTATSPIKSLSGYDLGSGAGLPGAVLALATADRTVKPFYEITLVESNARKAAFLRTVSRETGVRITVQATRIEEATAVLPAPDFITARALAPLAKLTDLAKPWMQEGATAFFHKGGEYVREMEEWPDAAIHDVVEKVSKIDEASRLLRIDRRDVRRGAS